MFRIAFIPKNSFKNRYHITRNNDKFSWDENNFDFKNNQTGYQVKQDIDFWKIKKILRNRSRRSGHKQTRLDFKFPLKQSENMQRRHISNQRNYRNGLNSPEQEELMSAAFMAPALLSSSSRESIRMSNSDRREILNSGDSTLFSKQPLNIISYTTSPDDSMRLNKSTLNRVKDRRNTKAESSNDIQFDAFNKGQPFHELALFDVYK